jgi:hypothetical protein
MTLRLTRFDQSIPFVDPATGKLTQEALRRLQKMMEQIEAAVNGGEELLETVIDLNDLVTTQGGDLTAVTAAAAAANTAAANANQAAADAQAQTALATSYPEGATITATDAGANVTVAIAAHTRKYPQADGTTTDVPVNGGNVPGLAYSTDYWLYYDDAARAGGAVTYQATTTPETGAQIGDRHAVGAVTTPAAAAPPEIGRILRSPGYVEP